MAVYMDKSKSEIPVKYHQVSLQKNVIAVNSSNVWGENTNLYQ